MRTLIAIIAVFALIVGGFFYAGIYRPRQQQQAKLARAAAVVDKHRAQVIMDALVPSIRANVHGGR